MKKDPKELEFIEAKEETMDNLEMLKQSLERCVNAGMSDPGETFHNKLIDLIDEAVLVKTYPELAEVISQAKTIENDLDFWFSEKGATTLSLQWPNTNK